MGTPQQHILPLNCQACGGPVEVAFEVVSEQTAPQTVRFACPYCGAVRDVQAPGTVMWVAMRQHGQQTEPRH